MARAVTGLPVGVALIGAGMIAPTHIAALRAARDVARLHTIVSRNPDKAASEVSDLFDGDAPRFTADVQRVADDPEIDIVIIATPPSVRHDLIGQLAGAGKHILLEKPIARTTAEATEVVRICEDAGVHLGILVQHRMGAGAKAAAQMIARDDLGALGHVEIAASLWREQSYYDELGRGTYERDGGGVMITQAIHLIDLALSLTGPVVSVQAMTATTPLHDMEAEDFAVAGLRFANGAVGSFLANTATFPHREETITLHFEQASLRIGRQAMDVSWRDGRRAVVPASPTIADQNGPRVAKHELHQGMIEDFIDSVRKDRDPIATGRAVLAAHAFIEAVETSARTGRVVDLSH